MNTREKAVGPGYKVIYARQGDIEYELLRDFQDGKPLNWPVLPAALVHRVWEQFVRDGYVSDDRALQNIYSSIRDNVVRLQVATIVAGHEAMSPDYLLEQLADESQHEEFISWLVDTPEGMRISDYGLPPLYDAVALAFEAKTDGARLKYLDRALNVMHQRGDLSMLFIEGGRKSTLELPCLP